MLDQQCIPMPECVKQFSNYHWLCSFSGLFNVTIKQSMTGQVLGFWYKGSREEFSAAKGWGDSAEVSRAAQLLPAQVGAPTPPFSKHPHCITSNMPVQGTSRFWGRGCWEQLLLLVAPSPSLPLKLSLLWGAFTAATCSPATYFPSSTALKSFFKYLLHCHLSLNLLLPTIRIEMAPLLTNLNSRCYKQTFVLPFLKKYNIYWRIAL